MPQGKTNITIDDRALVAQCRGGDTAAMERLIIKYQDRIFNVIRKICTNYDDAAELTQDTFVKAIENLDKFQNRSTFYTWLFRIAVNLTINHCRRNIRLGFESIDAQHPGPNARVTGALKDYLVATTEDDPQVLAQSKEICQIVTDAISKLEPAHRAVIILRDIENMDYAQIAKVLEIELGTVKSRLSRARNNLKEILEQIIK